MCQPKSKGGKRCAVHQSGSKFSMRVAKLKTGADDATISETFTELTKEGRNLPTPSPQEVTSFIEKKRFATELDPELDAHERKIELNQLDRAEQEIDSVTGASFHAWKNLRKRVAEKMKAFAAAIKRPAVALGLAGVVMFGAAGCGAQGAAPTPSDAPTSAPATTSAPVDPAASTYGDAIGLTEVTDENGTYMHVTVNPADDSMQLDPAKYDTASLEAAGFTQDDAYSAQQWAAKFSVEQGVDSAAADSNSGWENWKNNEANQFLDPSWKNEILNSPIQNSDRPNIIVNNANDSNVVYIRDGKARESAVDVSVSNVSGYQEGDIKSIVVSGQTVANYRFSDAEGIASLQRQGKSDDEIKERYPFFYDGQENTISMTLNWKYFLLKGAEPGAWSIAGYNNTTQVS